MKTCRIISILLLVTFFLSCQENKSYKSVIVKPTMTDTLRFENNNSFIIVTSIGNNKSMGNDLYTFTMEVMGIENGIITSYYPYTYTHMCNEESLYSYFTNENEKECRNFFAAHIGYPACGYPQYNTYFSIFKNKVYPIVSDTSYSDSGYGTGNYYYHFCNNDGSKSITGITGNHDADENDEQYIVSTYTDSCRFDFIKDKWIKTVLSAPGKVVRTERVLF